MLHLSLRNLLKMKLVTFILFARSQTVFHRDILEIYLIKIP